MAVVTICSGFGAQENKICYRFHFSPSVCYEVMGPDPMILVFWMLSFKPAFSLSFFTLIKRLLSSSLLSATTLVIISAYLRLLVFLLAIFDSSLGFIQPGISHDVLWIEVKYVGWQYTALTLSFANFESVCCSRSGSNYFFLICI